MRGWLKALTWTAAGLVLVIAVAAVSIFIPSGTTPAFILSLNGSVLVDRGDGYAAGAAGMELDEKDLVKTDDGVATIVLHESTIVTLRPMTEVRIDTLTRERQEVTETAGTVWSKVTRIAGVEEYNVHTPTTTATVRGTSLRTRYHQNGTFGLIVASGTVLAEQANRNVTPGRKLLGVNATYELVELSPEDIADIRAQGLLDIDALKALRLREIRESTVLVTTARTMFGVDDQGIQDFLESMDSGDVTEQEVRDGAPFMTPDAERALAYTREIVALIEAGAGK